VFKLINFGNVLNPSILFFSLGLFAQVVKSDLKLPADLVKSITIYLLLGIGIHGGVELAHSDMQGAGLAILVAVLLGVAIPLFSFVILHKLGKLDPFNAIAVAAHYGSVSAGTFLTAIAFLESLDIPYEKYPVMMLVMMESPAILVGLMLADYYRKTVTGAGNVAVNARQLVRESLTNGSVILLLGGLLIGNIIPDKNLKIISPFFDQMFMGVLCIFLLSMGMEAGKKLSDFKNSSLFLIIFGTAMPLILGCIGVILGRYLLGFSVGGATLMAVLAGSASYIAVPPAMRVAIPEANPSIYLTLTLGITFPFNVIIGIPAYYNFANYLG